MERGNSFLKSCSQERINVELFMEKLLGYARDMEYGSAERKLLMAQGIKLLRVLMVKCYEEGKLHGRVECASEVKDSVSGIIKGLEGMIISDTLKDGNDSETAGLFEELLKHYGKNEEIS